MSVWATESFLARQNSLRTADLRTLYPSQAWSMYRTIPLCDSLLDVGFGSVASLQTVRAINPAIHYTGIDLIPDIVADAAVLEDERTRFVCADFRAWEDSTTADLVQGWSLVYADDRPYQTIGAMWNRSRRFCLFDVRAHHGDDDIIDPALAAGRHGDCEVCYPILSWPRLTDFLAGLGAAVEFSTYYFPPSEYVTLADGLPQPFVASILLDRQRNGVWGRLVTPWPP